MRASPGRLNDCGPPGVVFQEMLPIVRCEPGLSEPGLTENSEVLQGIGGGVITSLLKWCRVVQTLGYRGLISGLITVIMMSTSARRQRPSFTCTPRTSRPVSPPQLEMLMHAAR